jgi:hypothetical protein
MSNRPILTARQAGEGGKMCTYYCSAASVGLNPTEEKVAEMIARLGHCHIPAG